MDTGLEIGPPDTAAPHGGQGVTTAAVVLIKGLKFRVTPAELRAHLEARAACHERRRAEKADELPQLRQSLDRLPRDGQGVTTATLEAEIAAHAAACKAFTYMAAHLFEDCEYCLGVEDLQQLEIVQSCK